MTFEIDTQISYNVLWGDDENDIHPAEIIERRPILKYRESGKLIDECKLTPSEFEYYVHYIDCDRRLDEWVAFDRFVLPQSKSKKAKNKSKSKSKSKFTSKSKSTSKKDINKSKKRKRGHIEDSEDNSDDSDEESSEEEDKYTQLLITKQEHTKSHRHGDDDEHSELTRVKNIQSIEMGSFTINTWYYSPYPEEYCGNAEEKLYLCEYCLTYMKTSSCLRRHCMKCKIKSPPGREIYRENGLSLFEIDGKNHKVYCQNLCLLSKLFLDHKTLYYDVDPFLFYVLCEVDSYGCHLVGYFSKEKHSEQNYNLSCILTIPPYQRKGYGKFLISLSYELTKVEETTGSPEKPISDLGLLTYESYWAYVILQYLKSNCKDDTQITVDEISDATGIVSEDVINTLQDLNLVKHWKGQIIVHLTKRIFEEHLSGKKVKLADAKYLHYTPPASLGTKDGK